jgi:D-serine deaminase-like pyridoxal phosphate-dependent protein
MMTSCASTAEIPTPAIVIDERKLDANIKALADYCKTHGIQLRPHAKTHKSLEVARKQIAQGFPGLTVAKVGEAEVLSEACDDFLIAYPLVDDHRTHRAAELAKKVKLTVAMDTLEAAQALSIAASRAGVTIDALVDLDVGLHRTGVASPELALELAQKMSRLSGLRLRGLFNYPGHLRTPPEKQQEELASVEAILREAMRLFSKSGLDCSVVSGGSTPTMYQSHLVRTWTEIRSGTYVYNDRTGFAGGWATLDTCAATILVTVISDAVAGKIAVDAGSKTLSQDMVNLIPKPEGNGYVIEYPNATITRLTEEHGEIDVRACDRKPKVGERINILPNHICVCINLADGAWLKREDGTCTWLKTDARGRVS